MKAPQLFCGALALAMAVSACQKQTSQPELKQTTNETGSRIKTAATKAGDQLGDMWLATKIQSKFIGDRDIKARDVNVSSHAGVVTLKGRVRNETAHQLALALAKNTDGVKQVVDNLDVEVAGPPPARAAGGSTPGAVATTGTNPSASSSPPAAATSDDARITTNIRSKYFQDDRIKGRHVEVTTNAGVVTLNGELADETERAEALLLARTTEGVNRVEDNLAISTPAPAAVTATVAGPDTDAALTSRLESQLASDNEIKNTPIDVSAKNGVVLLQGTVTDSGVKERVLTLARSTDGVIQVVDRIEVSKPTTSNPKTSNTQTSKRKSSPARKAKR
jgi:hyperosmotically inducible periplasmic protein